MQQRAFPALGVHMKEHDALLEQVRKMQDSFNAGDQTMTARELTTLREWLITHIKTKDCAYVLYLKRCQTQDA